MAEAKAVPVSKYPGIAPELSAKFVGFLVIEIENTPEKLAHLKSVIAPSLRRADLHFQVFSSAKRKSTRPGAESQSIFCKIYASVARLLVEADNIDMKLLVDRHKLREADEMKNEDLKKKGLAFNPPPEFGPIPDKEAATLAIPATAGGLFQNPIDPYDYVYAPYDVPADVHEASAARLFYTHKRTGSILSPTEGLALLVHVVENSQGGANLNLGQLLAKKTIKSYFVQHDSEPRKALASEWFVWKAWPWEQPIDKIRSYFGEKVAMYFSFLGMYTMWLAFPALLGFCLFIHQLAADDIAVNWLPIYGILIALWITLFLEFWKREQSFNAMKWGTSDFEATESLRPEFVNNPKAKMVRSRVHGKPVYAEGENARYARLAISSSLITTAGGAVIVIVLAIFTLRIKLITAETKGNLPSGSGGVIASIINALQIQILNLLYTKLALILNDWENHLTDTAYEDSLITKVCVFQFINSYISLFYVAFLKGSVTIFDEKQQCDKGSCLIELRTQLATIFITRLVIGNVTEVVIPYFAALYKRTLYKKVAACLGREQHLLEDDNNAEMSAPEKESFLARYDTFEDYLEMLIQFGYASLFVVAFPLAPLLALINNYFEIRVDSFKLLNNTQRPVPTGAQDIGSWYYFLEALGYFAVLTNIGVIIFTGKDNFFDTSDYSNKLIAFIIVEHAVFFAKYLATRLIPDSSDRTRLQLDRQEYLVNKHFRFIEDEIVTADHLTKNPLYAARGAATPVAAAPELDILPNETEAARHAMSADLAALAVSRPANAILSKRARQEAAKANAAHSGTGAPMV